MTKRWVTYVMSEAASLDKRDKCRTVTGFQSVRQEAAIDNLLGNPPPDASHFKCMRKAASNCGVSRKGEDLRFVLQAAEGT